MRLPALSLNAKDLSHPEDALQREWLVTNGLGGYASSTVLGLNTRKYHGLLVAALHPPGDRTVCVSKLDEDMVVGNEVFRLGMNEFQDGFFPNGHVFLEEFRVSPFPRFIYNVSNVMLEKTLFIPSGKNAVAVIYKLTNKNSTNVKVRVYPLLTCRHFHDLVDSEANPLNLAQELQERKIEFTFQNPNATTIVLPSEGTFVERPNMVRCLLYREETRRGESSLDDVYQPGYFEISVPPQQMSEFAVVAAADENPAECRAVLDSVGTSTSAVKESFEAELKQKANYLASFYDSRNRVPANDWLNWVLLAADAFVVRGGGDSRSVIAGYHWFESWGRDAFISLPGLLLVTGRFSDAEKVLVRFARYVENGLIPNFIPDSSGEPAYNTVDATLWYVNAALQYLKYTGDFRFVEENLWQTLVDIIERHERCTINGIHVDSDGLLAHGPRLTWMDAEVNGEPATPRAGKAIEIQALWYNALRTVQLLAVRFGHRTFAWRCSDMAARVRGSFNRKFWNGDKNCLFDAVDAPSADASVRPNQIIAAALDFPVLYPDRAEAVVDVVQHELLVPCGLRTLTRSDPRYRGRYEGSRQSRDLAYHNGTVWPWLLGPFTTAYVKVKESEPNARDFALQNFLQPLLTQKVFEAGLGTVSEVFDGDPPHKPGGCISQAWSVAEPLRAYVEDVLQVRPRYEQQVLHAGAHLE
jgi:predicted glycogen debranching enzyme